MVTDIEYISKSIQTGSIGAATNALTIFNHAELTNYVKDRYLNKGNPHILITGDTMKPFNIEIPDPSYPSITTMLTQEYHLEPPVICYCQFTRDGTYFQLIKQDTARDKQFVSTMPSYYGSSPTSIRILYQSVTIHSATHVIYAHPYYCFRPEANYSKIFSS